MKKTVFILIILLSFRLPLSAEQISPQDFAFGIPIETKEGATIYTFGLTKDMYRNMDRKDLGDIRIFNAAKEIVPHTIQKKENERISKNPPVKLGFFPVFQSKNTDKNTFSLNINTDQTGAIINVKHDADTNIQEGLSYYLIDLSALEQMPSELKFKVVTPSNGFTIKTTLEYSNNLTDWFFIKTDTTLVSLYFSGHSLVKDKIELAIPKTKYLRLSWPSANNKETKAEIQEILAVFPDKIKSHQRQWTSFEPASSDMEKQTFMYNIQGAFPFTRIQLDTPSKNIVVNAVIKSRPDKNSQWRTHYRGIFYTMAINGTLLTNDAVSLNFTPDTQWQVKILSTHPDLNEIQPKLKIGWISQDLYFLNQGKGPFIAAFGNYEMTPGDNLVDRLLSDLDDTQQETMVKKALPGELYTLGIKKVKKVPMPWQKWILWTVLIIGVVLLGIMAYRLAKQMEH